MHVATLIYLLVVSDGVPRCEAWTMEPERLTTSWTTPEGAHRLVLATVEVEGRLRVTGYDYARGEDYSQQSSCGLEQPLRRDPDGLWFGRARWFATAALCQRAIARGEPVATDLDACVGEVRARPVDAAVAARSVHRFAARLRRGGTLYVVDEDDRGRLSCTMIRAGGDQLRWAVAPLDGVAATRIASVHLYPGNREAFVSESTAYADGSSYGVGCGDEVRLDGLIDGVAIDDNPHYFTRAACRGAIAREQTRRRWLPREAGEDGPVAAFGPGVGGC